MTKKLPILDLKVWKNEDEFVVYQHNKKPVTSKKVLAGKSAQSDKCKRNLHIQEVLRRLLNCSHRLDWKTFVAPIVSEHMRRMGDGGMEKGTGNKS